MTCGKRKDDVKTAGSRYCGSSFGEACFRTERHPALRWLELARGGRAERGNLGLRGTQRSHKGKNHEGESKEAETRGGTTRSSREVPETGGSQGVVSREPNSMSQPAMGGADE
jgi:hypothetical protein